MDERRSLCFKVFFLTTKKPIEVLPLWVGPTPWDFIRSARSAERPEIIVAPIIAIKQIKLIVRQNKVSNVNVDIIVFVRYSLCSIRSRRLALLFGIVNRLTISLITII